MGLCMVFGIMHLERFNSTLSINIIHQEVCAQQFPKEHKTFCKENNGGYSLFLSAESLKELQQFWTPGLLFLTTNEKMFIPPVKE